MKLVEDLQMIAQNGNIPVFVKILFFTFCMLLQFSEELWMRYLLHSIFKPGYMLCCNPKSNKLTALRAIL